MDGLHADPWTGATVVYDMTGATVDPADTGVRVMTAVEVESDELTAAERAILDDLSMD